MQTKNFSSELSVPIKLNKYLCQSKQRQIIEPKIVGRFIGLSPLGTLAAIYLGLKLMGVGGIFIFPIGAIVIKKLLVAEA